MFVYIIDQSPTFYLFGLGVVMRWIGSYIHQRYPRVAFFQFSFSVVVFALFAGRRLAVNPPQDVVDAIEAFIRAGSFAMIAFGVTGGIGTMILLGRDWHESQRIERMRQNAQLEDGQRARRRAEERAEAFSNRPTPDERERQRQEQVERDRQRRDVEEAAEQKRLAALAERRTLRLQVELKTQAIPDGNRRKTVRDTIDLYLEDDVPLDEFKRRLQIVQDHISRESVEERTGFQSLTEIEAAFASQVNEISELELNDVEKASLRAYVVKEKQAVIHNFLKKGI